MGREVNGGFADYCIAKTSHIYPLPEQLNSKTGAAIQVLTTVMHAQNKGDVVTGDAVVVSGLGVTGLMHIQLAKARGAKVVVGTSRNAHKREIALALGADYAVSHGEEAKKTILEVTEGIGADIVIECVGNLSMLAEAVELARLGGKVIPFGIYPSGQAELPFYDFYFKELQIINVRAAKGSDFSSCIKLVSAGEVDLEALITHSLPYTELNSAIRMLMEPSDERIKVIMEAT
jgi:2-desacetyl-2-hydroxyethyl bacteriochlorophyllide A dehydrogenase